MCPGCHPMCPGARLELLEEPLLLRLLLTNLRIYRRELRLWGGRGGGKSGAKDRRERRG